ncbi:MAG: TolC family protein [Bacteroidales bacterium]|nr:TolC family protein [Bacteroidales bacterium]
MRKFFTILMAASVGLWVQAQERQVPWSLADCVDYALEHNITVRQQEISVAQREIELNTAQNSRLPGVSGSMSENFSFGRGLSADNTYENSNSTSTGISLGADVPVFQGFRIRHNIELQKLNLAAAAADLDRIKDNISVQVAQAYVQILYNMEILEVAKNQVAIDSLQVERIEAMVENGKASAVQLSQQKSALSQSKYSKTMAQNNLNLSLLDLSQLLELSSPEGFAVAKPDPSSLQPGILETPEQVYAAAVGVKPSIQAEMTRLDAASTQISLARSYRLPSISLSGGVGTNYYTSSVRAATAFTQQIKNNFSQYVGVNLSVPIFSRFSIRNSIRSSQLSYMNQELQVESAKKSLYKEIQQAYANAVASQAKYISAMESAASAQESFDLVQAKYETGKANITEFNESRSTMVKALSDLAQSRYESYFNSKVLDFYKGIPLR